MLLRDDWEKQQVFRGSRPTLKMMIKLMGCQNGFSEYFYDNFGFTIRLGIPTEKIILFNSRRHGFYVCNSNCFGMKLEI